jgi:hypothetical protein
MGARATKFCITKSMTYNVYILVDKTVKIMYNTTYRQ